MHFGCTHFESKFAFTHAVRSNTHQCVRGHMHSYARAYSHTGYVVVHARVNVGKKVDHILVLFLRKVKVLILACAGTQNLRHDGRIVGQQCSTGVEFLTVHLWQLRHIYAHFEMQASRGVI